MFDLFRFLNFEFRERLDCVYITRKCIGSEQEVSSPVCIVLNLEGRADIQHFAQCPRDAALGPAHLEDSSDSVMPPLGIKSWVIEGGNIIPYPVQISVQEIVWKARCDEQWSSLATNSRMCSIPQIIGFVASGMATHSGEST